MASDAMSGFVEAATYHFEQNRPFIPMYMHILLSALFPIFIGAHASLSRPSSAAKPTKKTTKYDGDDDDDDDEDEETVQQMEGLSPRDAIIFPITAGVVLAGLYWLIKIYGASVVNIVLGLYFGLIGTYSVAKLINDTWTTVAGIIMPTYYADQGRIWKARADKHEVIAVQTEDSTILRKSPLGGVLGRLTLPKAVSEVAWALRDVVAKKFQVEGYVKEFLDFQIILTQHNVLSALLGVVAVAYSILVAKPWWLTNLQGFAVSYGALQLMSPTTFATGTLILSGLFLYDIWAVFFTPLMVTVAKNLDVPIKLLFPRPYQPSATPGEAPTRSYSMLGLGDIVLPGLMIALALRFDLYMFYLRKQKKAQKFEGDLEIEKATYVTATGLWGDKIWTYGASKSALPARLSTTFPKPYFTASVIGYIIGMVATLIFMSVFQHAQPALLYLVPGVLTSIWGTALIRGEIKEFWAYSEDITGEASDNEESSDENKEPKGFFAELWAIIYGRCDHDKDKESTKAKAEESQKDLHAKAKRDPSNLFSLTIKHQQPKSTSTSKDRETSEDGSQTESTSSEDAVLVSSSDFDGAKEVQTRSRFRTVSTQQGTAEALQRSSSSRSKLAPID